MRLYIFADESGSSDPEKGRFVIAVAFCPGEDRDKLNDALLQIERHTKRGSRKWTNTPPAVRTAYLLALQAVADLTGPFYWRAYPKLEDVAVRTSEVIVAAVRARDPDDVTYRMVVIDGLSEYDRTVVRQTLTRLGLSRRKVVGARDESTALIRLADSIAGYLRHQLEGEAYALDLWGELGRLFKQV